ncbi:hypothetical protein G9A89_010844 [Geosiphon pyriformis]|nr:hypothetical protein G9A89_010844 [Geosiphon pyriformis]
MTNENDIASPIPTVQRPKRKKTAGLQVVLPKSGSITFDKLLDDSSRKEKEELASKAATDEQTQAKLEINTKPDIYQTVPYVNEDKSKVIVNYPPTKSRKEKDAHINDAINALNGKRGPVKKNMPPEDYETFQQTIILGKGSDQAKPRGSNYGQLDSEFQFPVRSNGSASTSSSSNLDTHHTKIGRLNDENKDNEPDDHEKTDKSRRRKSNLNIFAKEFTPSTDTTKYIEAGGNSDEEKVKTVKKDKVMQISQEVNGELIDPPIESNFQKKKRIDSQPDDFVLGTYCSNPAIPVPPINWDDLHAKVSYDVAARIEAGVQKRIERFLAEVKIPFTESLKSDGLQSSNDDLKRDEEIKLQQEAERRREESEQKKEEARLQYLRDALLKDMGVGHQSFEKRYNDLLSRYEELQKRQFEHQNQLKKTDDIFKRHIELQNKHETLQLNLETILFDVKSFEELQSRFHDLQKEHKQLHNRYQQLQGEITQSQKRQNRLVELEKELAQLRSQNVEFANENAKLSEENRTNKIKNQKQENIIKELTARELELSNNIKTAQLKDSLAYQSLENDLKQAREELQKFNRDSKIKLQNIEEENDALKKKEILWQQQQNQWQQTEYEYKKDVDELNDKIRALGIDLGESKLEVREQQRLFKDELNVNKKIFNKTEDNLRSQLHELQQKQIHLETKASLSVTLQELNKTIQQELEEALSHNRELQNMVESHKTSESQQLRNRTMEISIMKKQIEELEKNRLSQERTILELEASAGEIFQLRKKVASLETHTKELEEVCARIEDLEAQTSELERVRAQCRDQTHDLERLRKQNRELEEIQRLQSEENRSIKQETEKLNQTLDKLQVTETELNNTRQQLANKDASLKRMQNIELSKLLNRVADLDSKLRESENKKAPLQAEITRLREVDTEKEKLQAENNRLRNLEKEKYTFQNEKINFVTEKSNLQAEISKLAASKFTLEGDLSRIQSENASLEAELQQLKNSGFNSNPYYTTTSSINDYNFTPKPVNKYKVPPDTNNIYNSSKNIYQAPPVVADTYNVPSSTTNAYNIPPVISEKYGPQSVDYKLYGGSTPIINNHYTDTYTPLTSGGADHMTSFTTTVEPMNNLADSEIHDNRRIDREILLNSEHSSIPNVNLPVTKSRSQPQTSKGSVHPNSRSHSRNNSRQSSSANNKQMGTKPKNKGKKDTSSKYRENLPATPFLKKDKERNADIFYNGEKEGRNGKNQQGETAVNVQNQWGDGELTNDKWWGNGNEKKEEEEEEEEEEE